MNDFYIKLTSFQDINLLSKLALEVPNKVIVSDGKHSVNAKSLMCMFSLNLGQPLLLQLECSEREFESFRQKAARFAVAK